MYEDAGAPARAFLRYASTDESSDLRKALTLMEAVRDFCQLPCPDGPEKARFAELFINLIGYCGAREKRAIAATLAHCPHVPMAVRIILAEPAPDGDRPDVAFGRELLLALGQGGYGRAALLLEITTGLPCRIWMRLLAECDAPALCVILRGIGLHPAICLALLPAIRSGFGNEPSEEPRARRVLEWLDESECRRFLEELGARFALPQAVFGGPGANAMLQTLASRRQDIMGRKSA